MNKHLSRRDFLKLSAGAAGVGILAACAAPAQPTPAPAVPAPAAKATDAPKAAPPATGDYKGKFVVISVATDQRGEGKLGTMFEQANPGVQVTHVTFPSEKFVELYTAVKNTKEQVDILELNGQDLRRYATSGDLVDLSSIVTYKDRFRPVGLRTYTINDKLWALPWGGIGGFNIYYNKSILDKKGMTYPKTYAELVDIGKKLKPDGIAAYTHAGKNIYLWPVWFFTTYAQTSGNQSNEKTLKTLRGELKFTDPEVVAALAAIFKFAEDGLFIAGVNSQDSPASIANIVTNRAAFALGLDVNAVRDATPADVSLAADLLPKIVDKPEVKSQYPGGTGIALSIPVGVAPERRKLAESFLDFVTRDESMAVYRDTNKLAVLTTKLEGSNDPLSKQVAGLVDNLTTYLDWLWPPQITRAFQEGIQAGVAKQKNADEVASDIQKEFDKLVASGYKPQN